MNEDINNIWLESPEDIVWGWCDKLGISIEDLMEFGGQSYWQDGDPVPNPFYDSGVWNDFMTSRKNPECSNIKDIVRENMADTLGSHSSEKKENKPQICTNDIYTEDPNLDKLYEKDEEWWKN